MKYAVQLNCINPIRDITKSPLPPLEEISRGVSIHLGDVVENGSQSKRDLDAALAQSGTESDWFLETKDDSDQNLGLNKHLGAAGAISPGRV